MIQISDFSTLQLLANKHLEAIENYVSNVIAIYQELIRLEINSLPKDSIYIFAEKRDISNKKTLSFAGNLFNTIDNKTFNGSAKLNIIKNTTNKLSSLQLNSLYNLLKEINDEKKSILTEIPTKLLTYHNKFLVSYNSIYCNENFKSILKDIFSYEDWKKGDFKLKDGTKWDNYILAKEIGIKTCPYCNINYIYSVSTTLGEKKVAPAFDHFLDKGTYPLFRLSFFNLVPCCDRCNGPSMKGSDEFLPDTHIHPYFEGFGKDATFYDIPQTVEAYNGFSDEIEIHLNYSPSSKMAENIKSFGLDLIYKHHSDIAQELRMKKMASNDKYMEILQKTFPDLALSKAELYLLAFGNYYDEKDFHKRPLSKLTHDIAEELGLL